MRFHVLNTMVRNISFNILVMSILSGFPFVMFAVGPIPEKPLLNSRSQRYIYMFSSKSFIGLVFLFWSVTHFMLIFVYGVR